MSPIPTATAAVLPAQTSIIIETTPMPTVATGSPLTVIIVCAICFGIIVASLVAVASFRVVLVILYAFAKAMMKQISFWHWRSVRRRAAQDAEKEERELRIQKMREKLATAKGAKASRMKEMRRPPSAATGDTKQSIGRTRDVYRPRPQGDQGKELPPPPYQT